MTDEEIYEALFALATLEKSQCIDGVTTVTLVVKRDVALALIGAFRKLCSAPPEPSK